MNWHKLIWHDLRCGLLRIRYLFLPFITALPCFLCWHKLRGVGFVGSTVDLLMYCFKGYKFVKFNSGVLEFQLPIFWLLLVGGCLFLNLDYLLKDLTNAGQQVIIRSKKRVTWYLSKCMWNICSCGLYFIIVVLTAFIFSVSTGGEITLHSNPTALMLIFEEVCFEPISLFVEDGLIISFFLPFLTVAALSMLEMTLCLIVKPASSFVGCMILLVVALFCPSPFILGNGAMTIRNSEIIAHGISSGSAVQIALITIIVCVISGSLCFKQVDIIGLEE